jgi:hypothetical protein
VGVAAAATPLLAALITALVVFGLEAVARAGFLADRLAAPSYGGRSRDLDIQLEHLRAFVAARGGVDCVFLGNSLALFGFDPASFEKGFARPGRSLRCFNLAVPGTTVTDALQLARVAAGTYGARLVVFGVSFRDLARAASGPGLESMPWVRYRLGDFNLQGWLVDHFRAYRFYLTQSSGRATWSDPPYRERLLPNGQSPAPVTPVDSIQQRSKAARSLPGYFARGVAPRQAESLTELLSMADDGLTIVLAETPVHPDARAWIDETGDYYATALDLVEDAAGERGTPFFEAAQVPVLPADSWSDWWHLNERGAARYSEWLGEQVAKIAPATGPR